ncbi:MAG: HAD family phosphatase [Clostridia bacterium]|nr:HAD family phosphatase [Clostridia bacterium]
MKITGAIFDMDGTLINSMDYWAIVATEYLKSIGVEPPKDTDRDYLENGMKSWHEHTCPNIPYEEVSRGIYAIMDKYYTSYVSLKDGVLEMLERLKAHGVKMCLATATDRFMVEKILKQLGIFEYFSAIFTSKEVGLGKRYPLIYEKAREFLDTDRETTYVFEDAIYAIKTCHQNGIKVVGVYDENSFVSEEEVASLCDYYLDKKSKYQFEIE